MDKKILVTGAFGQIGSELVPALQKKYGIENLVALGHSHIPEDFQGIVEKVDINQGQEIKNLIEKYNVGTVYHLVSILSAKGEKDPDLTWQTNLGGLKSVLDLAKEFGLKVFWPSTIAAFGPTTPKTQTPQQTVMEPTTMYGVTKLAGEALCHYYFLRFGVDVRSVRYPGIISWKTEPCGGTTDYAVAMYYEAVKGAGYTCFVREDTVLPMMYMDDAIRATLMFMEATGQALSVRTSYNLAAISFSAKELETQIKKSFPDFKVQYIPDARQKIADSWPRSIDDSVARADWGWMHEFDLARMSEEMIRNLKAKFSR